MSGWTGRTGLDAGMSTNAGTPQVRNGRQGTREGPESPASSPDGGAIFIEAHYRGSGPVKSGKLPVVHYVKQ